MALQNNAINFVVYKHHFRQTLLFRQLIEIHEGSLSISSVLGEGTTITLLIPIFISDEKKMIEERRSDVLARAITSLEEATPISLESVTHTIGGVIGFYGFEDEGRQIIEYSRSLKNRVASDQEFQSEQERLLKLLQAASKRIDGEDDE